MRKLTIQSIAVVFIISFLFSSIQAEGSLIEDDQGITDNGNAVFIGAQQSEFKKNSIIVQFEPESAETQESGFKAPFHSRQVQTGGASSGLNALNALAGKYPVKETRPVFKKLPKRHKNKALIQNTLSNKKSTTKDLSQFYVVEFESDQDISEVIQEYKQLDGIASVQPNYIYTADVIPNDFQYTQQYAHMLTRMEQAWDITTGSSDIVVAVIGTGVKVDHPDLIDNIWINTDEIAGNRIDDDGNGFVDDINGWNFIHNNGDVNSFNENSDHETKVAGVIGATGNNSEGIAGAMWDVSIMPLRIPYLTEHVADAIHYAAENGAHVINMSFGNYTNSKYGVDTVVEAAVNEAFAENVVLVATAGNNSITTQRYPAALKNVIAVAATDQNDRRSGFSNYGSWVTVAAPGTSVITTTGDNAYAPSSGTSFAAPYVAGLAGLLLAKDSALTPTDIRQRIEFSADRIDTDYFIGSGRINARAALSLNENPQLAALIRSPMKNQLIKDDVLEVFGTAIGSNYQLELKSAADNVWTDEAGGTLTVDDVLGGIDVSSLDNGPLDLRLTAYRFGEKISDQVQIYLQRNIQEGWKNVNTGSPIVNSPSYADIDGDGDLEVVVANNLGKVFAWHHDGSLVSGWPQQGQVFMYGSPVIGDIDGDGDMEILQSSFHPNGSVHAWHHDGRRVNGWPKYYSDRIRKGLTLADLDQDGALDVIITVTNGEVQAIRGDGSVMLHKLVLFNIQINPVVGDMDGDGDLEIVVHQKDKLYAWHHDGSNVAGWPIRFGAAHTTPVMGDINGDGKSEVLAVDFAGVLKVFNGNGSLFAANAGTFGRSSYKHMALGDLNQDGILDLCLPNDLKQVFIYDFVDTPVTISMEAVGQGCTIADVNDDGLEDIVISADNGLLYAFDGDGNSLDGWPISAGSQLISVTPALGDIDQDGDMDVMIGNVTGDFYIYDLDYAFNPNLASWPMYQQNIHNSGFGYVLQLPAPPRNLTHTLRLPTTIGLSWEASSNEEAEVTYRIYRDGAFVHETAQFNFTNGGLQPNTEYVFEVSAVDAQGIESRKVKKVIGTTAALEDQTPWQSNENGDLRTERTWNYTMGYHFQPLKDGQITQLGGFFNGTKKVSLWNKDTGELLAETTVTAANNWGYADISPVVVSAGTNYTVTVYLAGSGGSIRRTVSQFPQIYQDIKLNGSTYISGDRRPVNNVKYHMYGQADIVFVPGGVNTVPILDPIGDIVVHEGDSFSVALTTSDSFSGPISFVQPANLPEGFSFADNGDGTAELRWTLDYEAAGVYPNIRFQVSSGGLVSFEDVTITVIDVDIDPPTHTLTGVTDITATSARISWTTNEDALSIVQYGLDQNYGLVEHQGVGNKQSHEVILSDLIPGTTYHFRFRSFDPASNLGISEDFTLTTLQEEQVLAQTPWQSNENGTLGTDICHLPDMSHGYIFQPITDGSITKLGGYFNGTKKVSLWNKDTSELLASTLITSANQWAYVAISPIEVSAGTNYSVMVYTSDRCGVSARELETPLPQTYSDIRIVSSTIGFTDAIPSGQEFQDLMFGQADVEFEPVPGQLFPQTPWQTNANGFLQTDLPWNYTMGYHFQPLKDGQITQLGGFFNGTKKVSLWNKDTGELLAATTVNAANNWGYADISPVGVSAGTNYTVTVYLAGSGGSYRNYISTLAQTYQDIKITGSTYVYGDGRPVISVNTNMYGQADIVFVSGTD